MALSPSLSKYKAILNERISDPLSKGWIVATDADFIAAINLVDRHAPVPLAESIEYLLNIDKWVALNNSSVSAAINLATRLDIAVFMNTDYTASPVIRDVNDTVPSVLTQVEADGLLALANNRQSRSQELGYSIRQRDLGRMRIEQAKGLI